MNVYQLDPLLDPRWNRFVGQHPRGSLFHSTPWLKALQRTYGYQPIAFTTSKPSDELTNGIVFCWVRSWLTGKRIVSLPFSDHCEPLCDSSEELSSLIGCVQAELNRAKGKYLEIRPICAQFAVPAQSAGLVQADRHFLHILDLSPDREQLFRNLDKDSIQRRIRRAERAELTEKCGRSVALLRDFYTLFLLTRSRHRLPATPYFWFKNLIDDEQNKIEFRIAYRGTRPISAILTFQFRDSVVYKNGCSDEKFNQFGATPWLLWRAIADAKVQGFSKFDFGRTEENNRGLLAFKNHWVAQPLPLVYWRFPASSALGLHSNWKLFAAQKAFSRMPPGVLRAVGKLIYRHIG
jgi:hypothetical protein